MTTINRLAELHALLAVGAVILLLFIAGYLLIKRWWTPLIFEGGAVAILAAFGFLFFEDFARSIWIPIRSVLADDAFDSFIGMVAILGGIAAIALLQTAALDTAANAFLNLRARYHSDDTGNAISLLVKFAWPVKEAQIRIWRKKLERGDFQALGQLLSSERDRLDSEARDELKRAVRRVSSYFDDVAFLYKRNIIDKPTAVSFVDLSGLNIFYEVCVPLHAIDNKSAPSIKNALLLRKVMRQQGAGMVMYDLPQKQTAPSERRH